MEKSCLKTRKNRRKASSGPSNALTAAARYRANQWLRKNRVKRVSWCDEELSSGGPTRSELEISDPAILIRGPPSPFLRYTRDELFAIRSLPLSKCRPSCLDDSFNNSRGCWDPDRWHSDKKHTDLPGEEDRIREIPLDGHKRRSDPRERIRKEQDGIVLSPQRRSFNSGCYMPANAPPPGVTSGGVPVDIPLGGGKVGDRESSAGGRRIGSGRILNRDTWDFRTDKQSTDLGMLDDSYSFRPGGGGPSLMRDRDDRYERRSFSREFDPRDKDSSRGRDRDMDRMTGNRSMNSRYSGNGERRRLGVVNDYQREPEEPEWFSGGPTSQHDTIELRGFEDTPEEKSARSKKQSVQQKKIGKKGSSEKDKENKEKDADSKKKENEQSTKDKHKSLNDSMKMSIDMPQTTEEGSLRRRSTSTPVDVDKGLDEKDDCKSPIPAALQNDSSIINASVSEKVPTASINPAEPGFILEDFLNLDSIPGLLTNGNTNEAAGSRFSQFFRRDSPPENQAESRRSSLQDEINSMLNDSNKYFTPISPAANSANTSATGQAPNNNLLEMLQRAKTVGNDSSSSNESVAGGKIHNVEELEARMRHGEGHNMSNIQDKNSNKNEEMMAFQKLLSQVTTAQGNQIPAGRPVSKTQPMSILEMLNKSQQADENAARASMGNNTAPGMAHQIGASAFGAPTPNVQHPPQVPPELVMKLLQVQQLQRQQQQISQFMANASAGHNFPKPPHVQNAGSSPLPNAAQDIQGIFGATAAQQQYTRELLQRPEAQAILHGLKHNKISAQHLMQQLNNPAMQQRHREMLIAILKTQGHFGHSPRNISPVGPPQNAEVMQHMMLGAQQQLRVSPLPNAYCVSPILATSPNTLSVHHPVIPPRMPSPMELQAHTRSILQGALIKKKLEEQSENFRKRQEMQRSHSPNPNNSNSNTAAQQQSQNAAGNNSPAKHVGSPTPLAFTPTSVLRKMTAEKEPDGAPKPGGDAAANGNVKDKNHAGNVASVSARIAHNQNRGAAGVAWNMNKQPQGRPIVKGGGGLSMINQNQPQVQFASNIEFQQLQNQFANIQSRSKLNFPQNHNMPPNYPNMSQFNNAVQQNNATSGYGPNFNNAMNRIHAQQAQQHLQRTNYQHQQLLNNPIMNSGIIGFNQRDGALSPTSNQLARWFSPELLAQASAGKLPPVNLAQNALSLEELERIQQSSATVHN